MTRNSPVHWPVTVLAGIELIKDAIGLGLLALMFFLLWGLTP